MEEQFQFDFGAEKRQLEKNKLNGVRDFYSKKQWRILTTRKILLQQPTYAGTH